MICPHCGTEVDDGAVFCTECGSRLVKDAVPAGTSGAPSSDKGRSRRSKAVIAAGLVAVLALGGIAGYYFGVYAPGQRQAAAQKLSYERAHGLVYVAIGVSGDGWDTASGASRLPVRVTGTNADGDVDEVQYVSSDGTGLVLLPGTYDLVVAASPIAEDGSIYTVPGTSFSVALDSGADVDPESPDVPASPDEVGEVPPVDFDASSDVRIDLSRADMAEVGDDEVDAALDYLEHDDTLDKASADQLKDALAAARDQALDQKREDEEAAAKQKAIDDLVARATSVNYDDGAKADGSDSTRFKFERVQTSDGAGPLLAHRSSGFYTVLVYSSDDASTAEAVAIYLFKLGLDGKLIKQSDWPSLGADGANVVVAGIFDDQAQADALQQKLEAQGITCGTVASTGPHS